VQSDLEAILVHATDRADDELLAMYADDMEKVSGIGEWGDGGPARYEAFLEWLSSNRQWINPVKLTEWATRTVVSNKRRVERGTFQELAVDFNAGEGYERWYLASDWAPYRGYFTFAESKLKEAIAAGGDPALLELADKQLLVANWETAWHTPATGPHGDSEVHGHASPWARALTSHSRHAAVTAAAAQWMNEKDGLAHASMLDVDGDNEMEVVIRNERLFAVFTPRWGGRLVSLFSVAGDRGAMVVGNPCDDWNWMEELNKYMDVPRNHPGAFADVGFEHEPFSPQIIEAEGERIRVRLTAENGIAKEIELLAKSPVLRVRYELPPDLNQIETEIGMSPDYLRLLRCGSACLTPVQDKGIRGCRADDVSVWAKPQPGSAAWGTPYQEGFGHGCAFRVTGQGPQFWIELGVQVQVAPEQTKQPRTEPVLV
jgi:starch synthase